MLLHTNLVNEVWYALDARLVYWFHSQFDFSWCNNRIWYCISQFVIFSGLNINPCIFDAPLYIVAVWQRKGDLRADYVCLVSMMYSIGK